MPHIGDGREEMGTRERNEECTLHTRQIERHKHIEKREGCGTDGSWAVHVMCAEDGDEDETAAGREAEGWMDGWLYGCPGAYRSHRRSETTRHKYDRGRGGGGGD